MTHTPLLPLMRKYVEHDPVAAAHDLETMEESEALTILRSLPTGAVTAPKADWPSMLLASSSCRSAYELMACASPL